MFTAIQTREKTMTDLSQVLASAAGAKSPKEIVDAVLGEWLMTMHKPRRPFGGTIGQLSAISFDVTGTLRHGKNSPALQKFAGDLCDAGIPVLVYTGDAEFSLTDDIFDKFRARQKVTGKEWFVAKPASAAEFRPGVHIDDDTSILRSQQIWGCAVVDIRTSEAAQFLAAWNALSPEERTAALQPWIAFDKSLAAKPSAAPEASAPSESEP